MVIPGLSIDGHGYSGIRGYSDKGGEGWSSLDYPWMATVTLASADTLTRGGEGWSSLDYPRMVTVTLASADTLTRGGGGGGGGGWTSLDYQWLVTVTLASADTLTWGGVDIPGLSMDGHSYSGMRGYSDKGGGGEGWTSLDYPWMVTVTLASADTLTRGGCKGGHSLTIQGWSQLLQHTGIL